MAVTRDQKTNLGQTPNSTSVTCTFTTNPQAGSTILAFVQSSNVPSGFTDNASTPNVYTIDKSTTSGHGAYIYRCNNILLPSAGSLVITVTTASASTIQVFAQSYLGVKAGAPTATNLGGATGTAVSTGSAGPAAAGGLIFGGFSDSSGLNPETITHTSSAPAAEQARNTNGSLYWPMAVTDSLAGAAQAFTWTLGDSVAWGGVVAAYDTAVTLSNTAEGGTSGTAASAANSGGASGSAFGGVNIGSGCTYAFDNARAAHGSLSYKIAAGVTSTFFYATWGSFAASNTLWVRGYFYFTANPGVFTPFRFVGANGTSLRGAVVFSAGGKLGAMNSGGSTVNTMTNSIALNQWIRIEAFCIGSATTGQIEIKLFNAMESTTPTETLTTAATINTGGTITDLWWGESGGAASIGPYWMDTIACSSVSYIGPAGVAASLLPQQVKKRMPAYFTRIAAQARRGAYSR